MATARPGMEFFSISSAIIFSISATRLRTSTCCVSESPGKSRSRQKVTRAQRIVFIGTSDILFELTRSQFTASTIEVPSPREKLNALCYHLCHSNHRNFQTEGDQNEKDSFAYS